MQKQQKKHRDMGKIGTRVMAAILVGLMVVPMVVGLVFYFI